MGRDVQIASIDVILDAAEQKFAEFGFAGAGMKSIATAAGVAQALLHYHFGTKEILYREVIRRRSGAINSERNRLLDQVDMTAPDALEQVVRAQLGPPLEGESVGLGYPRIFASLIAGPDLDQQLVRECYDDVATRVIDMLCVLVPGLERERAAWGYSLAIGSLTAALSQAERARNLGAVETGPANVPTILDTITDYTAAGIRALAR